MANQTVAEIRGPEPRIDLRWLWAEHIATLLSGGFLCGVIFWGHVVDELGVLLIVAAPYVSILVFLSVRPLMKTAHGIALVVSPMALVLDCFLITFGLIEAALGSHPTPWPLISATLTAIFQLSLLTISGRMYLRQHGSRGGVWAFVMLGIVLSAILCVVAYINK